MQRLCEDCNVVLGEAMREVLSKWDLRPGKRLRHRAIPAINDRWEEIVHPTDLVEVVELPKHEFVNGRSIVTVRLRWLTGNSLGKDASDEWVVAVDGRDELGERFEPEPPACGAAPAPTGACVCVCEEPAVSVAPAAAPGRLAHRFDDPYLVHVLFGRERQVTRLCAACGLRQDCVEAATSACEPWDWRPTEDMIVMALTQVQALYATPRPRPEPYAGLLTGAGGMVCDMRRRRW